MNGYWEQLFPHQCLAFSLILVGAIGIWFLGSCILPSEENGILGDNIPGIASLQETLLGIHADVKDIKADTTEIKEHATATKEGVTTLLQETHRQNEFAELGRLSGAIPSPTTPEDHFRNARFYEQEGDYSDALNSYSQCFSFDPPYFDPVIQYLVLLVKERGPEKALAEWKLLREQYPNNTSIEVCEYRFIQGFKDKRAGLNAVAARNKDFAPVHRELQRSYGIKASPSRSKLDADFEIKCIKTILYDLGEKSLIRMYVDKKKARELLDEMRATLDAYSTKNEFPRRFRLLDNAPLVRVDDRYVQSIEYSFDNENWIAASNFGTAFDESAGEEFSFGKFEPVFDSKSIFFRYTDKEGKTSDVFAAQFDPGKYSPGK